MPDLLEIRNISKTFPGVRALSDVSLNLRHGEVLGLCGENGAGKSTLMKLLTGVYEKDEGGQILLEGAPVEVSGPREAQHLGLNIIHQEFTLVPDLSVAQNIYLGREPKRLGGHFVDDRKLRAMAAEHLDHLGIKVSPNAMVRNLSVARQQMVEIAKALSFTSKVLVMDEPSATLTDNEIHTLFKLVREFVTPQTGVIYISHRLDEVKEITSRVSVLRDGEMVGTAETATTEVREIISMMVGRSIDTEQRADPGREAGDPVLEVEGLSTVALLRDVSFDLRRGEVLGFAGLMGAGRTEVARALVGADHRSAGTIKVKGRSVTIHNPAQAVAAGIGYLSEDRKRYGLLLNQSVSANVVLASLGRFASRLGMINDSRIEAEAEEHVETLRVKTPSVRTTARNLSGGNQQKVVLAKWLARDCDILIVDEPTRGIDVGAKQEIHDLIVRLTEQGKSIIVISSELPEVLRLSDRIAVMCEGRITGIIPNREATQESIMELATRFRTEGMGAA